MCTDTICFSEICINTYAYTPRSSAINNNSTIVRRWLFQCALHVTKTRAPHCEQTCETARELQKEPKEGSRTVQTNVHLKAAQMP